MSDLAVNALYIVGGGLVALLLSVIGFLIVRSLGKNDATLSKLDETIRQMQLSMKDKIDRPEAELISINASHNEMTEHVMQEHKRKI